MAHSKQPTPEVGMPTIMLSYTERRAGTIVEVKKNRAGKVVAFIWQQDNGMSESQMYLFERNPEAGRFEITLRKNGRWIKRGDPIRSGTHFLVGHRQHPLSHAC